MEHAKFASVHPARQYSCRRRKTGQAVFEILKAENTWTVTRHIDDTNKDQDLHVQTAVGKNVNDIN